ncbi:M15 family metallopeptidase [Paenibacillus typhae]|uniref:Peptidoglycan L-alanyl-D-glutamate endopeptidase CwlK n=1 Tax=Paenibacillus typhae TaxID=1174501 RepID=A0A1G8V5A0_9BACL|nr:M15 family metallopeptidase [Paenibacillus typhae]SDJ61252.1 peptidoglycan L-alanyl-D-glutamate endopeptidase CwlK [Paenibacillus typhae]
MLTLDQVKSKSAGWLGKLHPVLLAGASALIQRSYAKGIPIVITQGMRTIAEQNTLYAQGRTKPGNIVTNARGGSSYHNYGLAIDFALLLPDGKTVSWDTSRDGNNDKLADWQQVAQEAKKLGFAWGGDWTSFKDYSHLEMSFGLTTEQLRAGRQPTVQQVKDALALINGTTGGTDQAISVTLNGVEITRGLLENGITYAPVRAVAEALGAQVTYDAASRTVNLVRE